MNTAKSDGLFSEAKEVLVGGVNSPVRAFKSVGGAPIFMAKGRGSRIWDVDGNSYVDFVCSWGPLILGHANPKVRDAVKRMATKGTSFGAPTVPELRLAEKVREVMPGIQRVRFVNSGTEATMSALRLARAYTGRIKLLKFEGCYHGHADPFLTRAGSGMATFDLPDSAGIPNSTSRETLTVEYNNEEELEDAFRLHGGELAAAIVEPVAGNMGVVPPSPGFLQRLRRLCHESGAVLVFDEVITGFRVSQGGAQELYGIDPDLTCLGKIIGGGFPVGADGGGGEIMRLVGPEGPVYQAGTLSGNPVAMVAGLATLQQLNKKAYSLLERLSGELERGLLEAADYSGVEVTVNRVGSMLSMFFSPEEVRNFRQAKASSHRLYPRFHRSLLESGFYFPPSPFETFFLSTAHSLGEARAIALAARSALREARA